MVARRHTAVVWLVAHALVVCWGRYWTTAEAEKKAWFEVELEKPEKIARLSVVNAGAAFVEVLVAHEDVVKLEEYEVPAALPRGNWWWWGEDVTLLR